MSPGILQNSRGIQIGQYSMPLAVICTRLQKPYTYITTNGRLLMGATDSLAPIQYSRVFDYLGIRSITRFS